jgi:type II secretory pathway component PulF
MGSVEMMLLMNYGIPLAIKLLANGKDEKETAEVVTGAITGLTSGTDVKTALVNATPEQKDAMVNALFGVITGATGAITNLISALGGLFKKK